MSQALSRISYERNFLQLPWLDSPCDPVTSVPICNSPIVPLELAKPLVQKTGYITDGNTGFGTQLYEYQMTTLFPCIFKQCLNSTELADRNVANRRVQKNIKNLKNNGIKTGYDVSIIKNYRELQDLEKKYILPSGIKMLVFIPNPLSIASVFRDSQFVFDLTSMYKLGLIEAISRVSGDLKKKMEYENLAIQFDVGRELLPASWFEDPGEQYMTTILDVICEIHPSIEVGLHLCFGWPNMVIGVPPLKKAIAVVHHILNAVPHRIKCLHLPSLDATEECYLFQEVIPTLIRQNIELSFTQGHRDQTELTSKFLQESGYEPRLGKLQLEQEIADLTGKPVQFSVQKMWQYENFSGVWYQWP